MGRPGVAIRLSARMQLGRRMRERIRAWACDVRDDVLALYFCARHPDTPWAPKLVALLIAAYALSPIDLIPDFIPVLGLLDEAVLLPGAIWVCLRLIPAPVLAECRTQAQAWMAQQARKPRSLVGAAFVVLLWVLLLWVGWVTIRKA